MLSYITTITVLNLGQYISRDTSILSKTIRQVQLLQDIVLDRYELIATWLIYRPISEMNIFDISPRDAFDELSQTHLRNFYEAVYNLKLALSSFIWFM